MSQLPRQFTDTAVCPERIFRYVDTGIVSVDSSSIPRVRVNNSRCYAISTVDKLIIALFVSRQHCNGLIKIRPNYNIGFSYLTIPHDRRLKPIPNDPRSDLSRQKGVVKSYRSASSCPLNYARTRVKGENEREKVDSKSRERATLGLFNQLMNPAHGHERRHFYSTRSRARMHSRNEIACARKRFRKSVPRMCGKIEKTGVGIPR